MLGENINLELAQRRLERYSHMASDVIAHVANGHNGANCIDFLQHGIDAYRWLVRAEETLRAASYESLFDFSADVQETFDALYLSWLKSSELAEAWIASHQQAATPSEILREYNRVKEAIEDVVAHRDWASRSRNAFEERMAHEPW